MTSAATLRLAGRLARREVRRRPWRTLLVALLVALPVAGMTVAAGFVRTDRFTATDQWEATWGTTTDVAFGSSFGGAFKAGGGGFAPDPARLDLPHGSRVSSWRHAHSVVRTVDRERATAEVVDLPLTHGIGKETVQILKGRAPVRPDEAFLSRALAEDLGVEVGDSIDLERPYRASWKVTGIGERRAYWGSYLAVLAPGTAFPWGPPGVAAAPTEHAVDLPEGTTRQHLRTVVAAVGGTDSLAPHLRPRPPADESKNQEVAWSWVIGAIVLTVVGIVIASAFAAGARRQLSTLGQLAANGAAPSVLRGVLFLQGTWTGVLGSVLGLAFGGVGLLALAPHADRLLGRDVDPWELRVVDLVPVVVLGVVAATVAALIPARTTVRVPVLAALAGRRPLSRVPRWVTGMGAMTSLGGLGLLGLAVLGGRNAQHDAQLWALAAILGAMAVLLGACAVTPGYTSVLEPLAARLQGSWRLAARSLARQRTRTSAVVAAVCAASALAVGASAMILTSNAETDPYRQSMRPDEVHVSADATSVAGTEARPTYTSEPTPPPPEVVDGLRKALAAAEVSEVSLVRPPEGKWLRVAVPDEELDTGDGSGAVFAHNLRDPAVTVFDAVSADVYGLREGHRAVLEKEGVLALGDQDVVGELTIEHEGWTGGGPPPPMVFRSSGGAAFGPRSSEAVTLLPPRSPDEAVPPPIRHPVTVVDAEEYVLGPVLPRLLVLPSAVERLGLVPRPPIAVFRLPEDLTRAQITLVDDVVQDYHLDTASDAGPVRGPWEVPAHSVSAALLYPEDGLDPLLLEAILSGTALLFSLFVVAVSLALAAAENRDERDVLTVVGASPRTIWATSGRKAALLTALGGALAIPVGFLPVVVLNLADNPTPPTVFPWRVALLLLLAVPLVSGVVTTLASAAAARVRPVRVSTMAFD